MPCERLVDRADRRLRCISRARSQLLGKHGFHFFGHSGPRACACLVRDCLAIPFSRECSFETINDTFHGLVNDDSEFLRMENFGDAADAGSHNGRATRKGFRDDVWPAFARTCEEAYLCCIEPLRSSSFGRLPGK